MSTKVQQLINKYRPQKFADVYQPAVVPSLASQINEKRFPATVLLTGIPGTGKTTLARIIAMSLSCTNRKIIDIPNKTYAEVLESAEPCGECDACKQIRADKYRDYEEIDCGKNSGVEQIRDILDNTKYPPMLGKYRFLVLDEFHLLSNAAVSALLKSTEEPEDYMRFIFCTSESKQIKLSIKTRTQCYDLSLVPDKEIAKILTNIAIKEEWEYTEEAINLIANQAQGSVRQGISLLGLVSANGINEENIYGVLKKAPRQLCINLVIAILTAKRADASKIITTAYKEGRDLAVILKDTALAIIELIDQILIKEPIADKQLVELMLDENNMPKVRAQHLVDLSAALLDIVGKMRPSISQELSAKVGVWQCIHVYSTNTSKKQ